MITGICIFALGVAVGAYSMWYFVKLEHQPPK